MLAIVCIYAIDSFDVQSWVSYIGEGGKEEDIRSPSPCQLAPHILKRHVSPPIVYSFVVQFLF